MKRRILAILLAGCLIFQNGIVSLAEDSIILKEESAEVILEDVESEIIDSVEENDTEILTNPGVIDSEEVPEEEIVADGETETVTEEIKLEVTSVEEVAFDTQEYAANTDTLDSEYGTYIDGGDCGATEKDNLTWSVYDNDGDESADILVISGKGAMKDFSYGNQPWFRSCRNMEVELIVEEGITHIGEEAFNSMGLVGELKLPEGVKTIGCGAFIQCKFTGELKLPKSLESIGESSFAFNEFTGNLVIPENVTLIDEAAFVEVPFDGNLVILSEKIKEIKEGSFYDCRFTGELKIPESVTKINAMAFVRCKITKVAIYSNECEIVNISDFPVGIILSGYKGSTIETYANEAGFVFEVLPCKIHDFKTVSIDKEATCVAKGKKTVKCIICNFADEYEIPISDDHKWNTDYIEDTSPGCTNDGIRSIHCMICGTINEETIKTISATGHTPYSGYEILKYRTCSEDGQIGKRCSTCHEIIPETIEKIPAHGQHTPEGNLVVIKEATWTEEGQKAKKCLVCGEIVPGTIELIPRLTKIKPISNIIHMKVGRSVEVEKLLTGMTDGYSVDSITPTSSKIVNVKGKYIWAKKVGAVNIKINVKNYGSLVVQIKVQKNEVKTTGISVTSTANNKLTLKKGKTHQLKAELKPFTSTQKVIYKTSDKKVATVTSSGKIKAVGAGKATITVTSGSKKVKVTVTVPGITGLKSSVTMKKNKTTTLKPKTYGISEKVTYTSSNPKVAKVTSKGKITGIKKGKATITVKAGTYTVKCNVTVK